MTALKGYWIVYLDVSNPEAYKAYMAAAAIAHGKFECRLLARAGTSERVEGSLRNRYVLREFSSYDEALRCYNSPEYSHARPLRKPHSVGDFIIVEGINDPAVAPAVNAPKGYWMVHTDVIDANRFQDYAKASVDPVLEFGGRFLVRGGRQEPVEGKLRARCSVLEFPSYRAALDCYKSADYQRALRFLEGAAQRDLLISEGVAP
jgi:uncharacterized protein (DUF1330 family)